MTTSSSNQPQYDHTALKIAWKLNPDLKVWYQITDSQRHQCWYPVSTPQWFPDTLYRIGINSNHFLLQSTQIGSTETSEQSKLC